MIVTILFVILLLAISAFFSGSETALTTASRPLLYRYEKQGMRSAKIVNKLLHNTEVLIGTILLGNNLVNILASILIADVLVQAMGNSGKYAATFIMTIAVLIFSEILPKTLAVKFADRLSMIVAMPISWIRFILYPATISLLAVSRIFSKLLSPKENFAENLVAAEAELRGAIELHQGDDPEDIETAEQEKLMMRSILELDDVTVGEIMTHRRQLEMVDINLPLEEIIQIVVGSPHTRLPLYQDDKDNIVGVLHAKNLLHEALQMQAKEQELNLSDIASKPWFIPDSTSALDQMQAFKERREHFALVIDEYGALQGVITLEDVLEEIVGEITDEHDIQDTGIELQQDGSYLVAGETTIRDLNRALDLSIPDEEVTTVAGLLLYTTKRIPEKGQIFNIENCRFEVIERQRHRISLLKVTIIHHKK